MKALVVIALVGAVGITAAVLIERELAGAKRSAFGGLGGLADFGARVRAFFSGLVPDVPTDQLTDQDKESILDLFRDELDTDPQFSG